MYYHILFDYGVIGMLFTGYQKVRFARRKTLPRLFGHLDSFSAGRKDNILLLRECRYHEKNIRNNKW